MTEEVRLNFAQLHADLRQTMIRVQKTKKKIVFLDEVNFTKNTILKKAYSTKGHNISIDQSAIYKGYWSVVAAISTDNKIQHLHFEPKAIN